MMMKTGNEILWALAPEYAENVFEAFRHEKNTSEGAPRAEAPTMAEVATRITTRKGAVAVISINGPIARETWVGFRSGAILAIGQDVIRAAIEAAQTDRQVRAILLSINSPGGVVAGTKELADFIADSAKPIAAYVNGLAASAGYWLASATGRIFAPATAQVGSIGVIMTLADYSAIYQKMGVKLEHIASGKFKAAGSDIKPLTDEERAYFMAQLAELHAIFKSDVAARMSISAPEPDWAEAQILVGQSALRVGLVSQLVRDESEAIKILEENMAEKKITLELLAAEAPELLEQIRADAKAEARNGGQGNATPAFPALALAAVKAVCRPEDTEKVEKLLAKADELKLSAEQLAGMAALFAQPEAPKAEASPSQQILAALQAAHTAPVNAAPQTQPQKSALVADAERRAAAK